MARTGAPARRSPPAKPRTRPSQAVRRGGSRPAVGHRRQGPTVAESSLAWLWRVETLGMAIVAVAFFSTLSLAMDSSPLNGLVQLLGIHVLTLAFILAGFGFAVWHRYLHYLARYPRFVAAAPL